MTDIIMFGSSRQSHYSTGSGGQQTRGFSEHRESCPSVLKKSTDWPSIVINTWSSSGVIRRLCGDPWAPSVQIVLRVRPLGPTPRRAVYSLVWSFVDQTWSQGRVRCLRAIPLETPLLSTVITSLSLFTWVPLGIFLQVVSEQI